MKVYKYKSKVQATKKQRSMKRLYGYTPTVFRVKTRKRKIAGYVVVKPTGLRKVR